MRLQAASFIALLSLSTTLSAATIKLEDYASIKNALLTGNDVKVIVDFEKDCTTTEQPGPQKSPNIFSMTFHSFLIDHKTKAIITNASFLNPSDGSPFKAAAYSIGEVNILPNNTVTVDTYVITVPQYKTALATHDSCKIHTGNAETGVKFFTH